MVLVCFGQLFLKSQSKPDKKIQILSRKNQSTVLVLTNTTHGSLASCWVWDDSKTKYPDRWSYLSCCFQNLISFTLSCFMFHLFVVWQLSTKRSKHLAGELLPQTCPTYRDRLTVDWYQSYSLVVAKRMNKLDERWKNWKLDFAALLHDFAGWNSRF